MNLHKMCQQVDSMESFLEFLKALRADLDVALAEPYSIDGFKGEWANPELPGFLEAIQAKLSANPQFAEQMNWRMLADIFMFGRVYE